MGKKQTIFNKHKRKSGEAEWKRPDGTVKAKGKR
jgi:hypothetical protein